MIGLIKKFLGKKPNNGQAPAGPDYQQLKLNFREFKYLLRANNEVLSIIAEIETRMDQGLSMGLDFLRSRYIAASAKVFKMIRHLGNISGGRYRELYPAFDLIRHQIDDFLTPGAEGDEGILVLPLSEIQPHQGHLVGNKALNLARVARSEQPTNEGFVITTEAFRRVMAETGLSGQLREALMLLEEASYPNLAALSQNLREKIMAASLPPEVVRAIDEGCRDLFSRVGGQVNVSLRSSAVGEDTQTSFAGLYHSVLSVPKRKVITAYREVLASLYTPQSIMYRRREGLRDEDAEMAVLVQVMLDPKVSGVMYTKDPLAADRGTLLVSAVYGLGLGLVDGSVTPDLYTVQREPEPRLTGSQIGSKTTRKVCTFDGCRAEPVPEAEMSEPALEPAQVEQLAGFGLALEKEFGWPQDVEWALTKEGGLVVLQSRPLQLLQAADQTVDDTEIQAALILEGGRTARPGAASGPARLVLSEKDMAEFKEGEVLVSRQSSPKFAAVLDRASAVVTEVGGISGHMASLAREFGVPALLGVAEAVSVIKPGQVITVDAGAMRVYEGRVKSLLKQAASAWQQNPRPAANPNLPWQRSAGLITLLTLTDPRSPNFTARHCRTLHDIIRYIHEKSFAEMFLLGDRLGAAARGHARRLAHKLPFELWILDLGGGLWETPSDEISQQMVSSLPAKAFLQGLLDTDIHWDQPRPVTVRGLASVFSGAMLNPPADGQVRNMGEKAYAVISEDYLNFNCRVGYHFAALDSFCGPNQNDNYVSFRFKGGAATEDRRARRTELIQRILTPLGFEVQRTGDALSAFLKKYEEKATAEVLTEIGRLVIFTRQMDMLMQDERMVEWLAQAFIQGNYNLETDPAGT